MRAPLCDRCGHYWRSHRRRNEFTRRACAEGHGKRKWDDPTQPDPQSCPCDGYFPKVRAA